MKELARDFRQNPDRKAVIGKILVVLDLVSRFDDFPTFLIGDDTSS